MRVVSIAILIIALKIVILSIAVSFKVSFESFDQWIAFLNGGSKVVLSVLCVLVGIFGEYRDSQMAFRSPKGFQTSSAS
jgi:hypothetical protein